MVGGTTSNNDTRQEAGTPKAVFATLHAEYEFKVDVCASDLNYKLPDYLTKEGDALVCTWAGERVWCNPPYMDIEPWLRKSFDSDRLEKLLEASEKHQAIERLFPQTSPIKPEKVRAALAVDFAAYLLPCRCFNGWWRRFKPLAECHYFGSAEGASGRMMFEAPPGVKYSSTPFPVCLFLFGDGAVPGRECYRDAKTGARIVAERMEEDAKHDGNNARPAEGRVALA